MTRQLEALQKERNALAKVYSLERRRRLNALCADPLDGANLRRFIATLNHFGPDHAQRMIEYVRSENERWIVHSSDDMHAMAISMIGDRIVKIRERMGLVPYDDSLPGEPDDVWQICKKVLER